MCSTYLLVGLDILLDQSVCEPLGPPVPDHDGAALDDLLCFALTVVLAEAVLEY